MGADREGGEGLMAEASTKTTKPRSAAQIAATQRMIAARAASMAGAARPKGNPTMAEAATADKKRRTPIKDTTQFKELDEKYERLKTAARPRRLLLAPPWREKKSQEPLIKPSDVFLNTEAGLSGQQQ